MLQNQTSETRVTAAEALITGSTTTEAAKAAGVTRQTVSRWANHDPEFRALMIELSAGAVRLAQQRLAGLADTAITTIAHICKHGEKESDRIAAAKEILSRTTKIVEDPEPQPINPRDILGDEYDRVVELVRESI